ncbi:MAG: ROK family protein, partial [Chloroflexota bacterium]
MPWTAGRDVMHVIGIDVGGTKIAGAIVTARGDLCYSLQEPTRAWEGPETLMRRLIAMAAQLRDRRPDVAAIGVASAGQIDPELGTVVYANRNLPGWTGMPIAARLHGALSLPVSVDNDVRALALAEAHWGAGMGSGVLLVAALGTGIGGAIVLDGRLFRGAGNSAGELGHIPVTASGPRCGCGNRGCLEAYAGGPRIAAAYTRVTRGEPCDLRAVAAAARNGDDRAVAVFAQAGRMLGRGLAGLANTLDPDRLVIGGGVAE